MLHKNLNFSRRSAVILLATAASVLSGCTIPGRPERKNLDLTGELAPDLEKLRNRKVKVITTGLIGVLVYLNSVKLLYNDELLFSSTESDLRKFVGSVTNTFRVAISKEFSVVDSTQDEHVEPFVDTGFVNWAQMRMWVERLDILEVSEADRVRFLMKVSLGKDAIYAGL